MHIVDLRYYKMYTYIKAELNNLIFISSKYMDIVLKSYGIVWNSEKKLCIKKYSSG